MVGVTQKIEWRPELAGPHDAGWIDMRDIKYRISVPPDGATGILRKLCLLCKLFVEVDRVVIPGDFRETLHVGLFERASQGRKLADFERRPGRAKRSTNVRSTATKISNKRPPLGANETV